MPSSSKRVDTRFEQLIQPLSKNLNKTARQCGAFTYKNKIRSATELLRAVLLFGGLDKSLREVAGLLTLSTARITDTAVMKRLLRATSWTQMLMRELLDNCKDGCLPENRRFLAVDGSSLRGLGANQTNYRLHICLELVRLEIVQMKVTDKRTGEKLSNFRFRPGEVVVADRGYSYLSHLLNAADKGLDFVIRYRRRFPLHDRQGRVLDLKQLVQGQLPATVKTVPVVLKYSERSGSKDTRQVLAFLHAYRMSETQAREARRKCRRRYQKQGKKPPQQTLYLCEWAFVLSTLSPQSLSSQNCMALFRARWQVELAIKRLKSLLSLDKLRTRAGGKTSMIWFHGKLLYALLIEHRGTSQLGRQWTRMDRKRKATPWRVYKLVKNELDCALVKTGSWRPGAWFQCLQVLMERPRKRKLQRLPTKIIELKHSLNRSPLAA